MHAGDGAHPGEHGCQPVSVDQRGVGDRRCVPNNHHRHRPGGLVRERQGHL